MENLRDSSGLQAKTAEPLSQRVRATLRVWRWRHSVRSRLRMELQEMDVARTEKDVGIATGELRREANKPFWKT